MLRSRNLHLWMLITHRIRLKKFCILLLMPVMKTEIHLPHFLWASVSEGECVGEAVFTCDGKELGRLPLYAEGSSEFVKKQSFFSKIIDLYR